MRECFRSGRAMLRAGVVAAGALISAQFAHATELEIRYEGAPGPFAIGATVTVSVWMTELTAPAAGFQAFLSYDDSELTFISGGYTPVPFGWPIITPVNPVAGTIDLASGLDLVNGQTPTTSDSRLATLTFLVNEAICEPSIAFRPSDPPSRITNPVGQPIVPLGFDLFPVSCIGDIDVNGDVGFSDLLILLTAWDGECPADLDENGVVGFNDLLILLTNWGPC